MSQKGGKRAYTRLEALDCVAERLCMTRQALVKMWIAERLEKAA